MHFTLLLRTVLLLIIALHSSSVFSQSTESANSLETARAPADDRGTQLVLVQSVLQTKLDARIMMREKLSSALPDDVAEIEKNLIAVNDDIASLRKSFEQIAVGSVDLGVFGVDGDEFDWKTR